VNKNISIFAIGFIVAAALSAFSHEIDVFQAIGLAVVIAGTLLFIFVVLTLALFGAWVLWTVALDNLGGAVSALKDMGFMKSEGR